MVDTYLFRLLNQGSSNPLYDWLMPWITDGGHVQNILICCGLLILLEAYFVRQPSRVRQAWRVVLVAIATVVLFEWLVSHGLRNAVGRLRPPWALDDVILRTGATHSFSFPSSHAGNTMGVATVVFARYRTLGWALLGYAVLVAYSRVYCGVHYPLDICAGAMLGALLGTGLWKLTERWERAE